MSKLKKPKRKREFKPKEWLRKPDEEKKVMVYGYVKRKHKLLAEEVFKKIINELSIN